MRVLNATKGNCLAESAQLAESFFSRMRGLLGKPPLAPGQGLVLRPCRGVHTLFMRFPIDILYLSESLQIVHMESLPPNRVGAIVPLVSCVVELPAGTIARMGAEVGDQLAFG